MIDLVLVVMSDKGVESLLKSETTLGGDVSLTAGPKSLHDAANTDGSFKAEIFSYARSTGFFAGAGPLRDPRAPRAERRLARRAARHPLRGARERAAVRQRAHHLLCPTQEALRRPR